MPRAANARWQVVRAELGQGSAEAGSTWWRATSSAAVPCAVHSPTPAIATAGARSFDDGTFAPMWLSPGKLPHVLAPSCYHEAAFYTRERAALFEGGWHCVTTRAALAAPGDFVTLELLDQPMIVRNCAGELRAFQNVCAHRHALLTSEPCGHSERMRCQYHGWEYDADGRSVRIPDAGSFVPLHRGVYALRRLRAATCGQLVFVSLADHGPSLRAALGEPTYQLVEQQFSDDFQLTAAWTTDHAANWKVPVENALESYHVPEVHPNTFRTLSKARDATHTIAASYTALHNVKPPAGLLLRWISERWRRSPSATYAHHHAFPNLLIAHTDISSLAQLVVPTSPTTSRSFVFCFVHRGEGRRPLHRALGPLVGALVERYTREVLREDDRVFAAIQRGLTASDHAGVLSAREERVHAFQCYVAAQVAEAAARSAVP
jgi:choline monooxygenase